GRSLNHSGCNVVGRTTLNGAVEFIGSTESRPSEGIAEDNASKRHECSRELLDSAAQMNRDCQRRPVAPVFAVQLHLREGRKRFCFPTAGELIRLSVDIRNSFSREWPLFPPRALDSSTRGARPWSADSRYRRASVKPALETQPRSRHPFPF